MLIIALFVCIFFAFIMASMISNVQEGLNPLLGVDSWVTTDHFQMFFSASTLVTSVWTYIVAIIIIGVGYWAWIYVQRRYN